MQPLGCLLPVVCSLLFLFCLFELHLIQNKLHLHRRFIFEEFSALQFHYCFKSGFDSRADRMPSPPSNEFLKQNNLFEVCACGGTLHRKLNLTASPDHPKLLALTQAA